jgi:3-oxoadipate enol-lactonase
MSNAEILNINHQNFIVEFDGVAIAYNQVGHGEIPIIFIHGFPFDKKSWDHQLDFLKDTHRAIAVDIRGFGKSSLGEKTVNIDLYANDLIHLMDALKIEKAVVCGLSMGGYILLNAVSRFSDRFEAIVLCDTQCIADSPDQKAGRAEAIKKIENGGLEDFAKDFIKKAFSEGIANEKENLLLTAKEVIVSTSVDAVVAGLNAIAQRSDTCSILGEINIPTLIICGDKDKITIPAQSEYLNQNIKNSKLRYIKGAGHLSNIEEPTEFNEYLLDFLKSIED